MSTGPSFLPFLEAANALWPLSLDDLRAIERARSVPRPLRAAAEATIFLKDQVGERYSGNEMQAALVKLAARLATIEGLHPDAVQGQIRSAVALARAQKRKPRRFLSLRAVVVVFAVAIAVVLITVALAVARVPLPGDWDDVVRRIFSQGSRTQQSQKVGREAADVSGSGSTAQQPSPCCRSMNPIVAPSTRAATVPGARVSSDDRPKEHANGDPTRTRTRPNRNFDGSTKVKKKTKDSKDHDAGRPAPAEGLREQAAERRETARERARSRGRRGP